MSRLLFLAAGVISGSLLLGLPVASWGQDAPPKITVLVIYRRGPTWLEGKPLSQQPLKEHGRYLLSLYEKGLLSSAGPFADDSGGAIVLEVTDENVARRIISEDPAVKTGVLVQELHAWSLVPWAKYLKQ